MYFNIKSYIQHGGFYYVTVADIKPRIYSFASLSNDEDSARCTDQPKLADLELQLGKSMVTLMK